MRRWRLGGVNCSSQLCSSDKVGQAWLSPTLATNRFIIFAGLSGLKATLCLNDTTLCARCGISAGALTVQGIIEQPNDIHSCPHIVMIS